MNMQRQGQLPASNAKLYFVRTKFNQKKMDAWRKTGKPKGVAKPGGTPRKSDEFVELNETGFGFFDQAFSGFTQKAGEPRKAVARPDPVSGDSRAFQLEVKNPPGNTNWNGEVTWRTLWGGWSGKDTDGKTPIEGYVANSGTLTLRRVRGAEGVVFRSDPVMLVTNNDDLKIPVSARPTLGQKNRWVDLQDNPITHTNLLSRGDPPSRANPPPAESPAKAMFSDR
jgi:hypothetical protein